MNTLEPEGGKSKTTKIIVKNTAGYPFIGIPVEHGHEKGTTDRTGTVELKHINGSPVIIYGIIVKNVVAGVENIFQFSTNTGNFRKV